MIPSMNSKKNPPPLPIETTKQLIFHTSGEVGRGLKHSQKQSSTNYVITRVVFLHNIVDKGPFCFSNEYKSAIRIY